MAIKMMLSALCSLALIGWVASDHVTRAGCEAGWCGTNCQTRCSSAECDGLGDITCTKDCEVTACSLCHPGFWGHFCSNRCNAPNSCDPSAQISCSKEDGSNIVCSKCKTGFYGSDCSKDVKCPQMSPPKNGRLINPECMETEQKYGTKCSFACDDGYTLTSGHVVICDSSPLSTTVGLGAWAGSETVCTPNTCIERAIDNSVTLCAGQTGTDCFPAPTEGKRCMSQLRCSSTGFFVPYPAGAPPPACKEPVVCTPQLEKCGDNAECVLRDEKYTCECVKNFYGDGMNCYKWSLCAPGYEQSVAPSSTHDRICTDVNECLVDNGGCDHVCINTEGSFKCQCKDGYHLGDNKLSCVANICKAKEIPNGTPCQAHTEESCKFTCNEGYFPSGTMHCESDGVMRGVATCEPISCIPAPLVNSEVVCHGKVGDKCIPVCNAGYEAQGSLVCEKDGVFRGHAQCSPLSCEPFFPKCFFEGKISQASCGSTICKAKVGSSCSAQENDFSCGNGWKSVGRMDCVVRDGFAVFVNSTKHKLPICEDINECKTNNGACQHQCINTPGSYECACAQGFTLQEDGLSCAPNPCEDSLPHPLASGVCHGRTGDLCYPVGIPGFTCTGVEVCQSNGQFTSTTTCWARPCVQHRLENSVTVCSGTTGSVCTPKPVPGATCTGTLVCLPTGEFASMDGAKCTLSKCPDVQLPGANNTCSGVTNQICVPEPLSGHICSGVLRCTVTGKWTGLAVCEEQVSSCSECNVRSTCDMINFRPVCTCKENYWGSGKTCNPVTNCSSPEVLALEASTRHNTVCRAPYCTPTTCGVNTVCVETGNKTEVRCICKTGFHFGPDGRNCVANKCPIWHIEGSQPCYGNTSSSCTVRSIPGYACSGVMRCGNDGKWFGNGFCQRIECAKRRLEGAVNYCTGRYKDICTVKCESLHRPVPEHATVTCDEKGQWVGAQCVQQSQKSCSVLFGQYRDACGKVSRAVLKEVETCPEEEPEPVIPDKCDLSCGDFSGVVEKCIGAETNGVTYWEADEVCRRHGARLCSLTELEAGVIFSGFDDQCDIHSVWTSTPCAPGRVWVDVANPAASDRTTRQCLPIALRALTRCCADAEPYPDWNECDCEGCNGLGDCDQVHGRCVNTLGSYQCVCDEEFYTLAPDGKSCVIECPMGMEYSLSAETCIKSATVVGSKSIPSGVQLTKVQTGVLELPVSDTPTCGDVRFKTPYLDESLLHIFISATFLRTSNHTDPLNSWAEDVTTEGFRACVSRSQSRELVQLIQAESTTRAIVTWIAGEQSSQNHFGEESLSLFRGRSTCLAVSFGPSASTQAPNHITLSAYDAKSSFTPWIQGLNPKGFEICAEIRNPEATKEVAKLSWLGQFEPFESSEGDVAIGSTLMHENMCNSRSDRAVLGSCACKNLVPLRNGTINGTNCESWEFVQKTQTKTLCRAVSFKTPLRSAPSVFTTPGYLDALPRNRGIVSWVAWSTPSVFKLCYSVVHGNVNLNNPVVISWTAIADTNLITEDPSGSQGAVIPPPPKIPETPHATPTSTPVPVNLDPNDVLDVTPVSFVPTSTPTPTPTPIPVPGAPQDPVILPGYSPPGSWHNGDVDLLPWPTALPPPIVPTPIIIVTVEVPTPTETPVLPVFPETSGGSSGSSDGSSGSGGSSEMDDMTTTPTPQQPISTTTPTPTETATSLPHPPTQESNENIPIEDVVSEHEEPSCFSNSLEQVIKSIATQEELITNLNDKEQDVLEQLNRGSGVESQHDYIKIEAELADAKKKLKDLQTLKQTLEQLVALAP